MSVAPERLSQAGQANSDFSLLRLLVWVLRAVIHSIVLFGFAYAAVLGGVVATDGRSDGLWSRGAVVNLMLVLVVNAKV